MKRTCARSRVPLALALLVATCTTVGCTPSKSQQSAQGGSGPTAEKRKAGDAPAPDARPVPVVVATVSRRDVPVELEGLGTVTAYQTVTVRTRVDGLLDSVQFKEGQPVRRGSVIAQLDQRPFKIALQQAQAQLERDKAQLHGAQLNLDRYVKVREQNLISQQQVDDQRALVDQFSGTVHADEAAVDNARLQLEWTTIVSPIDGVTGVRLVDAGNLVHQNDATGIVVITQLDPIAVLFTLPQDELPRVADAMKKGTLSVSAKSRDGDAELAKGAVTLVDNLINTNTATIRVKALFANASHALWPNQFVKATLRLSTKQGVLVMPATAVQRGPKGTFTYVVGADARAEMRPCDIEGIEGDTAIVAGKLVEGEQVVIDGQSQLRPGALVIAKAKDGRPASAPSASVPSSTPASGPSESEALAPTARPNSPRSEAFRQSETKAAP